MMKNLTSSGPRYDDPVDIIGKYLSIKLNKEHPFILVDTPKMSILASVAESSLKAIEQFYLFTRVIKGLSDPGRLITLLEVSDQTIISSSSSDSMKTASKKGISKKGATKQTFALLELNRYSKKVESIDQKAQIILGIANSMIKQASDGSANRETFFRDILAAALRCHTNEYIKPLCLETETPRLKRKPSDTSSSSSNNHNGSEKSEILKELHKETLGRLVLHWLSEEIDSKKQIPLEEIKEEDRRLVKKQKKIPLEEIKEEDRRLVKKHQLFESSKRLLETLQEGTIRFGDQQDMGADIIRQMSYIQIDGKNDQGFIYKKNSVTADSHPALFFKEELLQFKKMVECFLIKLSINNAKTQILDKIDRRIVDVQKTFNGLSELYNKFLTDLLSSFDDYARVDLSIAARILYHLLLTLNQNTYAIPATAIAHILKNSNLKTEPNEKARKFLYKFEGENIELTVTFKYVSEKEKFKLCILNKLTAHIKNASSWTSEILLQVLVQDENERGNIQKNVVDPLQYFGFKVAFS